MKQAFTLISLLCALFATAQPAIDWRANIGGTQNDEGRTIVRTSDGGYFHIGRSNSADLDIPSNQGDYDLSLVKLAADGTVTWAKSYGGSAFDGGFNGMECANGDFIVIGSTNSNDGDVSGNHGDSDIWVLRLDAAGNIIWQFVFGGTGADLGLCIKQTSDGGFIASGTTASADGDITGAYGGNDMLAMRISPSGDVSWSKNIGGSGGDRGWHIIELDGGNFVLGGDSNSLDGDMPDTNFGAGDAVAVFIADDGLGTVTAVSTYGGVGDDEARFLAQKPDGDLVFAGATLSEDGLITNYHGGYDYWVFSADGETGEFLWGNCFGGSANDYVRFMHLAPNGDVLTGGFCDSSDGDLVFGYGGSDAFLVRVNGDDGTLRWGFNYGGAGDDLAFGACTAADGGFVVTVTSNSMDSDVYNALGNNDFWIFKLENDGVSSTNQPVAKHLSLAPNPSSGHFTVQFPESPPSGEMQVLLADFAGRTVGLPFILSNSGLELDATKISNGLYSLRVLAGDKTYFAKLVVQK